MEETEKITISLILHNIRSVYNAGGIFRTADASGVDHIYLTGYTPRPIDRFGRYRADFHKSALGAERSISWSHEEDIHKLIEKLKANDQFIVSVEQDDRSQNYHNIPKHKNIALVFGNEVDGIEREILDQSDMIAEIPMRGAKESLNVMVSVGVVLFACCPE